MGINRCRVCGGQFYKAPLLKYKNMPAAAQFMPNESTVGLDKGIDLEIVQCSGCGLVQLTNEPVTYYKEVIRAAAYSPEMKEYRIKQFADFVNQYNLHNKKVVEIGCGKGEYMQLMQEAGADTYGIEGSSESVQYCLKDNLKVSCDFIESTEHVLNDGPFDAFFILNYLEHIPDINSLLSGVKNNLVANGIGLVEVPNFDMIIQKNIFAEFISDHLYYFTKDSLEATLKQNGFDIIKSDVIWYDYIISAVVKKREPLDITAFGDAQQKLKTEIDTFISNFDNGKVAIWGAGHQALTLIPLAEIADNIKYVVDSAPFKQGKLTPATHIPIVPPDKLDSEPVDAIIVMAASYSDEVARIIKQKYGQKIKIAILRDLGLEIV